MARKSVSCPCRCKYCHCYFTPDPRQNGRRHVTCGHPRCRQLYKNEWNRNNYADVPAVRTQAIQRVAAWRLAHPDYWRPVQLLGSLLSAAIPAPVATELLRLADTVRVLEFTLTGLTSLMPTVWAIAPHSTSRERDRARAGA